MNQNISGNASVDPWIQVVNYVPSWLLGETHIGNRECGVLGICFGKN